MLYGAPMVGAGNARATEPSACRHDVHVPRRRRRVAGEVVLPILERGDREVQAERDVRLRRAPAGTRDVRRLRRRLAREKGPRGLCGSVQQHAQVRRLDDPQEAGVEQLTSDSRRRSARARETQAGAGPGYRDPRFAGPRPIVDASRPHRRVPTAGLPNRLGEGEAPVRRRERREPPPGRIPGLRHGRREADLSAGRQVARRRPCEAEPGEARARRDAAARHRSPRLRGRRPLTQARGSDGSPSEDCPIGCPSSPAHAFARSSSRRSQVSRAPSSIPDPTMPSRASKESNWDATVSRVFRPRSSNVAVSRTMWPGAPSNSNVETSRSGGTISRYTPLNANSVPSGTRLMYRQTPPGRTSILSTVVEYLRGPHHTGMSFGSVYARKRRSRGTSKTRDMVTRRLARSVTNSVPEDVSDRVAASFSRDSVQPCTAPSRSGPAGNPAWRSVIFVFPPRSSNVTVRSSSGGKSAAKP